MTKILLPPKNTVWGVIVNPNSSNTYRHCLSFDNEAGKDLFINTQLFNGGDYKQLMQQQPNIAFVRNSATNGEFKVNIEDYPNETFTSLLNKDFVILWEDGVYSFYTVVGERDGTSGNIIFTCELDIFFTYDITKMFNNQKTRIETAHIDRFALDDKKNVLPILNNYTSPIYSKEEFDDIAPEDYHPSSKNITCKLDYSEHMINVAEREQINEIFNNGNWSILYHNTKEQKLTPIKTKSGTLPYSVSIGLVYESIESFHTEINFYLTDDARDPDDVRNNTTRIVIQHNPEIIEDGNTIHNGYTTTGVNPFANYKDQFRDDYTLRMGNFGELNVYINRSLLIANDSKGINLVKLTNDRYVINTLTSPSSLSKDKYKYTYMDDIEIFPNFNFINFPYTKHDNYKQELKSYFYPYRKFKFSFGSKNYFDIKPQYLKDTIEVSYNYAFMSETHYTYATFRNYQLLYDYNNNGVIDLTENKHFIDINNYSLPTDINAWNEFNIRNKSQQTTAFATKGIGVGLGLIGAAKSAVSGNTSGITAGISASAGSAFSIANQIAMRSDIKNTPNKLVPSSSSLVIDSNTKNMNPSTTEYLIHPNDLTSIRQHFYKYGYAFHNRLYNINDLLKTRFWFNYIKAPETFENIHLQVSSEIKQIINDTIADGITIWHWRDGQVFQGIKNYDYINTEWSVWKAA